MFWVYILASKPYGTLYTGSTDSLTRRIWEHREKVRQGFTARYGVTRLVWFEAHDTRETAFRREQRIKEWRRAWKVELIEALNPSWRDLYDDIVEPDTDVAAWLDALNAPPPLIPAKAGTQAVVGADIRGPLVRGFRREAWNPGEAS